MHYQTFPIRGEVNADNIVRNVIGDETCVYVDMMHEATVMYPFDKRLGSVNITFADKL